jgi:hypothetical protein
MITELNKSYGPEWTGRAIEEKKSLYRKRLESHIILMQNPLVQIWNFS